MKLFKISTSSDAIQSSGGSSYISKSGIYDVIIKFASVEVSKNGAQSVNFNIEYNGNAQTIYGPYITSTKNEPLKIGMQLINSLGVIAGLGDNDELEVEQETFKVGKEAKAKEFNIITQFTDLPIKIRLQEEYSINATNKEIRKSMVPVAFYRAEDGASVREIVNNSEVGVQLEKDKTSYADAVRYLDDLTAEDVEAWKKAKSNDATSTQSTAPASQVKPAGSLFKR